jgi:quinol monooxygenase YgiN
MCTAVILLFLKRLLTFIQTMVKHIVFWKLKNEANGLNKRENAEAIKQKLEALKGNIEGLIDIEVGFDFLHSAESVDIVLYSTFSDKAALEFYQQHPLHKAVMPFIGEARLERRVVDYEV